MPALIFDLDGTLIDMVYAHVFARQRALAEAGMAIDGWRIHAGALRVYRDPADLQRSLDELGIVP